MRVVEHNTAFVKGKNFILGSVDIHAVPKMIFVSCFLFRFRLWGSSRQDFTIATLFGSFRPPFFLLLKPVGIGFLFLWVQVSVHTDKFTDTLLYLLPRQVDMRLIVPDTS